MPSKLNLDAALVDECRVLAKRVAADTLAHIREETTVSVERAVVRLFGVDGVDDQGVPLPNVFVDALRAIGGIGLGAAHWLGLGMMHLGTPAQAVAEAVAGGLDLRTLADVDPEPARAVARAEAARILADLSADSARRQTARDGTGRGGAPLLYVLTATGNVHEDVVHARAVADRGGDIVAVIRSTAQSLLDYVPYGATTVGFGGTYATQENFRIMRAALDAWSAANGRYIRLSSFCSGLCMPEIAVIGAIEGLDNMVNDALYGILYRDINMVRTLIDQRFSRRVNGCFGITINTGEDNYLRTSDAVEAAPSVVASQMINYELALACGVPESRIAVGNAFEIDPDTRNGLLFEIAQAQLTRELFPGCPVKYMPPTRHMDGNLFRTHANDVLFNLVSILTGQSIQTLGVPTEGIFTPHIHDRVLGLECARYVHGFGADLGGEIRFREDGVIQTRARTVLRDAHGLLRSIAGEGLLASIGRRVFGNVGRGIHDGKGADGIVRKDAWYFNPFEDAMEGAR